MLPPGIGLLHGPGCPVCVTPPGMIDAAVAIARRPGAIFCSFGDMLRVPGERSSLLAARARGADALAVLRGFDESAAIIGQVEASGDPGNVALETPGGLRALDLWAGDQLPRIC